MARGRMFRSDWIRKSSKVSVSHLPLKNMLSSKLCCWWVDQRSAFRRERGLGLDRRPAIALGRPARSDLCHGKRGFCRPAGRMVERLSARFKKTRWPGFSTWPPTAPRDFGEQCLAGRSGRAGAHGTAHEVATEFPGSDISTAIVHAHSDLILRSRVLTRTSGPIT